MNPLYTYFLLAFVSSSLLIYLSLKYVLSVIRLSNSSADIKFGFFIFNKVYIASTAVIDCFKARTSSINFAIQMQVFDAKESIL